MLPVFNSVKLDYSMLIQSTTIRNFPGEQIGKQRECHWKNIMYMVCFIHVMCSYSLCILDYNDAVEYFMLLERGEHCISHWYHCETCHTSHMASN